MRMSSFVIDFWYHVFAHQPSLSYGPSAVIHASLPKVPGISFLRCLTRLTFLYRRLYSFRRDRIASPLRRGRTEMMVLRSGLAAVRAETRAEASGWGS